MQTAPAIAPAPLTPTTVLESTCNYQASAAGMRIQFYGTPSQLESLLIETTVQDLPHRKVVTWAVRNQSTKATYGLRISYSPSSGEVKVATTLCP